MGSSLPAGEILDRAAREADLDRQPDRLRHAARLVREGVLQVGRAPAGPSPRTIAAACDQGFVPCSTEPSLRPSVAAKPAARGGEGLEPERREQLRRADVPRVRQQERLPARCKVRNRSALSA